MAPEVPSGGLLAELTPFERTFVLKQRSMEVISGFLFPFQGSVSMTAFLLPGDAGLKVTERDGFVGGAVNVGSKLGPLMIFVRSLLIKEIQKVEMKDSETGMVKVVLQDLMLVAMSAEFVVRLWRPGCGGRRTRIWVGWGGGGPFAPWRRLRSIPIHSGAAFTKCA